MTWRTDTGSGPVKRDGAAAFADGRRSSAGDTVGEWSVL